MRLAVVGKGGAGKSVITGTLARLMGRKGEPVLAADLDVNPGLALSLGLAVIDSGLPLDAVQPAPPDIPYGFDIRSGLSAEDAVARYSVEAPDRVRFLQIGNIGRVDHGLGRFVVAIRRILRAFRVPGWHVLGDLEAGTATAYEGYADFAERALIVVEPTWTSGLTARRLAGVVRQSGQSPLLVGNKVRGEADLRTIRTMAASLAIPLVGAIPFDPQVMDAEKAGVALVDHAAQAPATLAIRQLAETLA
jgi:CO dehydrogenase maturation factor